jgi:hypothetical protein
MHHYVCYHLKNHRLEIELLMVCLVLLDFRCTQVGSKPEHFFITHLKRPWANAFGRELGFGVSFGYSLRFFPYVE